MDTVEVKQVVITTLTRRGKGKDNDPIRIITEIWDMDGERITEIDPCPRCENCATLKKE